MKNALLCLGAPFVLRLRFGRLLYVPILYRTDCEPELLPQVTERVWPLCAPELSFARILIFMRICMRIISHFNRLPSGLNTGALL